MSLDDHGPSAVERIEKVRARHDRERGRARRERPRPRVGEGDRLVRSGLEIVRVEHRPVGARREKPVGALRIGDRVPGLAAGQRLGLLGGPRRDHVDEAECIENVQLAAVGLRRDRDRLQRDREWGGIERRIDGKRCCTANDGTVSGEHERPRIAEGQGDRVEHCVARRFHDGHDDQRCGCQHDHVIALDRERDRGRVAKLRTIPRRPAGRCDRHSAIAGNVRARAVVRDGEGDGSVVRNGFVPDDAIVAERQDPEGHELFREMRVRPLVGLSLG